MIGAAGTQGHGEFGDVASGHRAQALDAASGEEIAVAGQITTVGAEGVARGSALDREVVEVGVDLPLEHAPARLVRGFGCRGARRCCGHA